MFVKWSVESKANSAALRIKTISLLLDSFMKKLWVLNIELLVMCLAAIEKKMYDQMMSRISVWLRVEMVFFEKVKDPLGVCAGTHL